MPQFPNISEAEWQVMKILWMASPLSARQIIEALEPEHDWKPKTVKTLLNRLVGKGAISFVDQGRHYLYRPAVSEKACIRAESRTFLDRVFSGALMPMIVHYVEQTDLSDEEIEELKQILSAHQRVDDRENSS